jgi:hypothetical protein
MLMEEGAAFPGRMMAEPAGARTSGVSIDRDQARVELSFVMDERDRIEKQARMAAAERDRLAEVLRAVEDERDRLRAEVGRLADRLEAAERANAGAANEIAWLRALTERLALPEQGPDDIR